MKTAVSNTYNFKFPTELSHLVQHLSMLSSTNLLELVPQVVCATYHQSISQATTFGQRAETPGLILVSLLLSFRVEFIQHGFTTACSMHLRRLFTKPLSVRMSHILLPAMWTDTVQVCFLPNTVSKLTNSTSLGSPKTVNQCTIPHFVGVTWQKGDAIYYMEFASKTTPTADGFCSTFTTLTGAVTGVYSFFSYLFSQRLRENRCCKWCRRRDFYIFGPRLWILSKCAYKIKKSSGFGFRWRRHPVEGYLERTRSKTGQTNKILMYI